MNMESFDWTGMAQKVAIAVIILLVTWLLAKLVKWGIGKLVGRVNPAFHEAGRH